MLNKTVASQFFNSTFILYAICLFNHVTAKDLIATGGLINQIYSFVLVDFTMTIIIEIIGYNRIKKKLERFMGNAAEPSHEALTDI